MSEPLQISKSRGVATLTLNRPDVHNAMDGALILGLTAALLDAESDAQVRIVVLRASGASFSAGADLAWMRSMAQAPESENRADAERLAQLMRSLNFMTKPTIARIHGAAYGGGVGLIACCDIAIASDDAKFGLTEVKLGLVPAVISPYVIAAIGARAARRLFLTAEIFNAARALQIGLVHEVVSSDQLEVSVGRAIELLAKGGPIAQAQAKQLVLRTAGTSRGAAESIDMDNAAMIARLRVAAEGQEGLNAFLERRPARFTAKE